MALFCEWDGSEGLLLKPLYWNCSFTLLGECFGSSIPCLEGGSFLRGEETSRSPGSGQRPALPTCGPASSSSPRARHPPVRPPHWPRAEVSLSSLHPSSQSPREYGSSDPPPPTPDSPPSPPAGQWEPRRGYRAANRRAQVKSRPRRSCYCCRLPRCERAAAAPR